MRAATSESGTGIDLSKIRELEERLDNFRIQTSDDMTIRGNAWQGYAINAYTCDELGRGGGPPTPTTGACCLPDGTCEEVTIGQCILDGGTFVGGLCADADCPQPTGACCVGSDCTIETEDDCTGMGGTYQGDNTTCDPNPCMVECSCGFEAYDGSGRRFLTQTTTMSYHDSSGEPCDYTMTNDSNTVTYDPSDCSYDCSCSGSIERTGLVPCSVTLSGACLSFFSPPVDGSSISEDITGCNSEDCRSCNGIICHQTSLTATSATFDLDGGGVPGGSGSLSFTLSDECTPI